MGWKVFAAINAIIVLLPIFESHGGPSHAAIAVLGDVLDVPAAVGLLLYAFNAKTWCAGFWKVLAAVFGGYSLIAVAVFVEGASQRSIGSALDAVAGIGALALVVALQFFTWLALKRYSTRPSGLPLGRWSDRPI